MTTMVETGPLLARLLECRGLGVGVVAERADVREGRLVGLLGGDAVCDEELLRRLAPALGLHASDVFAIVGAELPADLAPRAAIAQARVAPLLHSTARMKAESRGRVMEAARAMPLDRFEPALARRLFAVSRPGPRAVVVRLLENRNLRYAAAAKALYVLTLGHVYVSGATIPAMGAENGGPKPEIVAASAAAIGLPVRELAALAGVALPETPIPLHPAASELAQLVWEARRLSPDQLDELGGLADSLYRAEGAGSCE
ncbi:hypothetical protein [Yinghuangia seranimata]|uniref:hypothetical protein n=1 Tax=Yinghuangia seranimata TaxID=408067 RepID=UPI00248AB9D6|nr:hypothetical protein [Yinghuangia seranimata]MDI2130609.1 hypothetical protein [Yinghuangia seranimata]